MTLSLYHPSANTCALHSMAGSSTKVTTSAACGAAWTRTRRMRWPQAKARMGEVAEAGESVDEAVVEVTEGNQASTPFLAHSVPSLAPGSSGGRSPFPSPSRTGVVRHHVLAAGLIPTTTSLDGVRIATSASASEACGLGPRGRGASDRIAVGRLGLPPMGEGTVDEGCGIGSAEADSALGRGLGLGTGEDGSGYLPRILMMSVLASPNTFPNAW